MCARTSITRSLKEIQERFKPDRTQGELFLPRYNAAPTNDLPVLYRDEGVTALAPFRWGLVPSWAKDAAIGVKMINARAETLAEKVSYRKLLKDRRCLVPVDGFYEWVVEGGRKHPVRITLKSGELFAIAGLWDDWKGPGGKTLRSFTVVTTASEPHRQMRGVHDRMPVILEPALEKQWLDAAVTYSDVLAQNRALELDVFEVSRAVNSARNDSPECAARLPSPPEDFNLPLPL